MNDSQDAISNKAAKNISINPYQNYSVSEIENDDLRSFYELKHKNEKQIKKLITFTFLDPDDQMKPQL